MFQRPEDSWKNWWQKYLDLQIYSKLGKAYSLKQHFLILMLTFLVLLTDAEYTQQS